MNRSILLSLAAALFSTAAFPGEQKQNATKPPKQVQSALTWQLPANPCKKPKPPGKRKEIFDNDGIRREEWDVDYYTLKRYTRKERRWEACVDDYKANLAKSFNTLKDSAQYGLSQPQADIILGKMQAIQAVLQSAEGELLATHPEKK